MRHRAFTALLLLSSCTTLNPEFDPASDEQAEASGDSLDGSSSESASETEPTSVGEAPDPDTTEVGESESSDTGEGETSETGGVGEPSCGPPLVGEPLLVFNVGEVIPDNIPSFAAAPSGCVVITVCHGDQPSCSRNTTFMAWAESGGGFQMGEEYDPPVPILVHIEITELCDLILMLDAAQILELSVVNELGDPELVEIPMPCGALSEVKLWIGDDGSAFWDPTLLECAAGWPA